MECQNVGCERLAVVGGMLCHQCRGDIDDMMGIIPPDRGGAAMNLSFFVDHPPVAQPRHRVGKRGAYLPKEHPVHAFKQMVAVRARIANADDGHNAPFGGPLRVTLDFTLPRPKSMRLLTAAKWASVKPDLDNLVKACLDALNGIAWLDDAQVCVLNCGKRFAAGDEDPGVYVTVGMLLCTNAENAKR